MRVGKQRPDPAGPDAADPDAARSDIAYYGQPIVKPPVWTWEVPAYFFVGGLSGMAAVIAFAALLMGAGPELASLCRSALWLAVLGAAASAGLLVLDLGRPARFLNMLRVLKPRSPMSVGAWTLTAFGAAATFAAILAEMRFGGILGAPRAGVAALLVVAAGGAAVLGALLATYTGVLLAASAIPTWFAHRKLLPAHFGVASLGSAAALLELLGYRLGALHLLGFAAAALEIALALVVELGHGGGEDRAVRQGRSGAMVRAGAALAGPLSLLARLAGWVPAAALAFLAGAALSRFGWVEAGRASARDPRATLVAQSSSERIR